MWRWKWPVATGLSVSFALICAAAPQPPPPPSSEAQPNVERGKDERLTPLAQRYLEEAKARLQEQRRAEQEKELVRQRQDAQRLAVQMSREKMKQQVVRDREAQHQVELVRERQLKAFYYKGLSLYQQGAYQEAVDALQQMSLMDPSHPLVKSAEQLITRAELKLLEQRLRSNAEASGNTRDAIVPELEDLLTQKRMEVETIVKYAKLALQDNHYETASKLLTAALVRDPSNHDAQQLLERAQMAKLTDERDRLGRQIERDEQSMINEVARAQLLPKTSQASQQPSRLLTSSAKAALGAKLSQPISFDFNDVALSDVLQFVADAANVSIVPSPQMDLKSRRVTLKVTDLPLEQAIRYLTKSLSLAYRIEDDAILIATAEEFSNEPLQTRVFFLRNGLGPFALQTAAIEPNPALAMESIKSLIERSVPQPSASKLVIDERSGALIVTNTVENLDQVERLLSQLDVTPVQVLIEARFIELTMTDLEQSGVESVLTGNFALNKKTAANGTRGAGHQIASGSGEKFGALARETEGLNLTLQGVLTGTQFETVLHLLEESKKSKTLSAPRVTTLNNQTALIRIVDEFRYPTRYEVSLIQFDINGDGDFDDAGETEFANVPQDFQQRDIGILLHVTPSVGKDMRTITLVLAPEVSQFSQFRDLGGGVTVPEFTSSQLTTSVLIEASQTIVLGGLMKDTTSEQTSKIPVLGDLPIVGGLFRQKEESNTRKNLLIFITARVLGPRGETT